MIILDSSLIVAYSNEADINHSKAVNVFEELDRGKYGTCVTTDYVFDEVVTVMLVRTGKLRQVAELGEKLLDATILFRIDEELFKLAWKLFKDQRGEKLGFTDCTTLAVCKVNGISNIATLDRDFRDVEGLNVIGF